MKLRTRIASMAAIIGASLVLAATPSSATDWGGVLEPASSGCSATTIKTVLIKSSSGASIGSLEIRWSAGCNGNWAKVTTSSISSHIGVRIHSQTAGHTGYLYQAGSDEYNVGQAWTWLVRTAADPVCAYADVTNGPTHYSAVACAS